MCCYCMLVFLLLNADSSLLLINAAGNVVDDACWFCWCLTDVDIANLMMLIWKLAADDANDVIDLII